jgi:hypothetical protein
VPSTKKKVTATGNTYSRYSWFSSVAYLQANAGVVFQIWSYPPPSTSLPIHYSLTRPPFDAM